MTASVTGCAASSPSGACQAKRPSSSSSGAGTTFQRFTTLPDGRACTRDGPGASFTLGRRLVITIEWPRRPSSVVTFRWSMVGRAALQSPDCVPVAAYRPDPRRPPRLAARPVHTHTRAAPSCLPPGFHRECDAPSSARASPRGHETRARQLLASVTILRRGLDRMWLLPSA